MHHAFLGGRTLRVVAAASAAAVTLALAPAVANPVAELAPTAAAQTTVTPGIQVDAKGNISFNNLAVRPGAKLTVGVSDLGTAGGQLADNLNVATITITTGNATLDEHLHVSKDVAAKTITIGLDDTTPEGTYDVDGTVTVSAPLVGTVFTGSTSGTITVSKTASTTPTDLEGIITAAFQTPQCFWVGGEGFVEAKLTGDVPEIDIESAGGNFPGTLTYTSNQDENSIRVDWKVPADATPGSYEAKANVTVGDKQFPVTAKIDIKKTQAECNPDGSGSLGNIDLGSVGDLFGDGTGQGGSLEKLDTSSITDAIGDGTGSGDKMNILLPLGLLAFGGLALGSLVQNGAGSVALPFPIPFLPGPVEPTPQEPQPQPEPAPAPGPGVDNGRG